MASSRQKKKRRRRARPAVSTAPLTKAASTPPILVHGRRLVRNLVLFCLLAEVAFVLLDATVNYGRWTDYGMIRRLCNIAREDGLASWFGTTQTFMVGLTLWWIYRVAKRDGRPKPVVIGWLFLALFFMYMAADDGAEIHERMGSAFKKAHESSHTAFRPEPPLWGEKVLNVFPSYAWQIVFMPFFGTIGIFMLVFLWKELAVPGARCWVGVALMCFCVGVGLDFVEGLDEDHRWNLYTQVADRYDLRAFTLRQFGRRPYDALRHFSKSFEEFLEMAGTTILWGVFLSHLFNRSRELNVRFTGEPAYEERESGSEPLA